MLRTKLVYVVKMDHDRRSYYVNITYVIIEYFIVDYSSNKYYGYLNNYHSSCEKWPRSSSRERRRALPFRGRWGGILDKNSS